MTSDSDRRLPRAVLLIGAGRRARRTGATLAALSALDAEGERRGEPLPLLALADPEELLAPRPLEGLLILESARVPGEDIGFVRRFLERHAGWRLLVIGADKQESRALLALPRAQWLAWPPDLDELGALLAPGTTAVLPTVLPGLPAEAERTSPRRTARAPAKAQNGAVDVGPLLEELLAGAALHGESTARIHYSPGAPCTLPHERGTLLEGLGGLIELARLCAGADGLVRAALDPGADGVRIGLEFPRASLPEKELPTLLGSRSLPSAPELAEGLRLARRGVGLLREIGGEVELSGLEGGRVRCAIQIPSHVPERSRRGKAEDPFA